LFWCFSGEQNYIVSARLSAAERQLREEDLEDNDDILRAKKAMLAARNAKPKGFFGMLFGMCCCTDNGGTGSAPTRPSVDEVRIHKF